MSRDEYILFRRSKDLISTFCVCADEFQGLSKAFHYRYLFSSLKLLTNFENAYWNPLRIPFFVIGRCSQVPTSHWLQGKWARINLSQAASGMISRNHRRLHVSIISVKIAAIRSLKPVTGSISKLVSNFKGVQKVLVPFYYYWPLYSSRDTILLKHGSCKGFENLNK